MLVDCPTLGSQQAPGSKHAGSLVRANGNLNSGLQTGFLNSALRVLGDGHVAAVDVILSL